MIEPTQKDIDALALNWQSLEEEVSRARASALSNIDKAVLIKTLRGLYRFDDMIIIMQSMATENKISFQTVRERMRRHVPGQTKTEVGALFLTLAGVALIIAALGAPAYAIIGSWETGKTQRLARSEFYKMVEKLPPEKSAEILKKAGLPGVEVPESWIDKLIGDVGKLIIIGGVVFLGGAYLLTRGKEQVGKARSEYIAWRTKRARLRAERAAQKFRQLKEEDEGETYEPEGPYQ